MTLVHVSRICGVQLGYNPNNLLYFSIHSLQFFVGNATSGGASSPAQLRIQRFWASRILKDHVQIATPSGIGQQELREKFVPRFPDHHFKGIIDFAVWHSPCRLSYFTQNTPPNLMVRVNHISGETIIEIFLQIPGDSCLHSHGPTTFGRSPLPLVVLAIAWPNDQPYPQVPPS